MENGTGVSMAAPIRLQDDFGGGDLRVSARRRKDGGQDEARLQHLMAEAGPVREFPWRL